MKNSNLNNPLVEHQFHAPGKLLILARRTGHMAHCDPPRKQLGPVAKAHLSKDYPFPEECLNEWEMKLQGYLRIYLPKLVTLEALCLGKPGSIARQAAKYETQGVRSVILGLIVRSMEKIAASPIALEHWSNQECDTWARHLKRLKQLIDACPNPPINDETQRQRPKKTTKVESAPKAAQTTSAPETRPKDIPVTLTIHEEPSPRPVPSRFWASLSRSIGQILGF